MPGCDTLCPSHTHCCDHNQNQSGVQHQERKLRQELKQKSQRNPAYWVDLHDLSRCFHIYLRIQGWHSPQRDGPFHPSSVRKMPPWACTQANLREAIPELTLPPPAWVKLTNLTRWFLLGIGSSSPKLQHLLFFCDLLFPVRACWAVFRLEQQKKGQTGLG